MDLQIELFSTPTIEGRKILSSKGFVCANVVLDARGINEDYQMMQKFPKYMDKEGVEPYHVELFDALEREVLNKGGNAVIDLHIEHSYVHYVHRVDYYYLLISAQGTAVVIEGIAENPTNSNINGKVLEQQVFRKHILTKLKEWYDEYEKRTKEGVSVKDWDCYISDEEWVFVCRYPDISYAEYLHLAYTEGILADSIYVSLYSEHVKYSRFFKYFKKLPYEKQIELAYKYCNQQSSKLIEDCDLFDAKHILEWAQKGELGFAADCLKARKKKYCAQDLEDMQKLYDFFVNLPEDKIEEIVEEVKSYGIRRYLCKSCDSGFDISEKTKEEPSYCRWCKKNKRGLTKEQEEGVKEFGIKVEALRELLSNKGK